MLELASESVRNSLGRLPRKAGDVGFGQSLELNLKTGSTKGTMGKRRVLAGFICPLVNGVTTARRRP